MRNVLVTGASRGIGKSIALKYAKEGFGVALHCHRNEDLLLDVKNAIKGYQVPCYTSVGDIGDYEIAKQFVIGAKEALGAIDVLINNAGVSYTGLFQDMALATWHDIFKTNLHSVFNTCHLLVPEMVQRQRGRIINISSVWGEVGASCEVAYASTKGGLDAFTKSLAKELGPSHISVNAIACGAIDTSMNQWLSSEEKESLIQEIPMSRLGTPDEVANLAYYLGSEAPTYLTGEIIRLDGSWI